MYVHCTEAAHFLCKYWMQNTKCTNVPLKRVPCLFVGKSIVIGNFGLSDGHKNRGSMNLFRVESFDTNIYFINLKCRMDVLSNIKWSLLHNKGEGQLCLFLAKFIDFAKVLLNIRWSRQQQGAPCLFSANAMPTTKCWMPAQIIRLIRQLAVGDTRKYFYNKTSYNNTWNGLTFWFVFNNSTIGIADTRKDVSWQH